MQESPLLYYMRLAQVLAKASDPYYAKLVQSQYQYLEKAFAHPEQLVYVDYYFPTEILYALDLIPVMTEHCVNVYASFKKADTLLNLANQYFYNSGTCSFHKPILPALEEGVLVRPLAFATTSMCNESAKYFGVLANKFQTGYYCVDMPYERNANALQYMANQFKELASYFGELTGKPLDLDRLREVIRKSNQMREYLVQGHELRKAKPSVISGGQMLRMGGFYTLHGTDDAIEVARSYYELVRDRIARGEFMQSEKYRVVWSHLRPFYTNDFSEYIEKDLGVTIAYEETNDVFWEPLDTTDPFMALAEKTLAWLYHGDVNRRIRNLQQIVQDYQLDGIIHFSHISCRVLSSQLDLLKAAMRKAEIPFLILSGDCVDHRNYSKQQLITRVEAFVEMLS